MQLLLLSLPQLLLLVITTLQIRKNGFDQGYAQTYTPLGAKTAVFLLSLYKKLLNVCSSSVQVGLLSMRQQNKIFLINSRRYGNYELLYNDKGLLNLGIVKEPLKILKVYRARIIGFPASLPMIGGFAGGTAAGYKAAKALLQLLLFVGIRCNRRWSCRLNCRRSFRRVSELRCCYC